MTTDFNGKPDAGNPHVRFDEGANVSAKPRRGAALLYDAMKKFAVIMPDGGLKMPRSGKSQNGMAHSGRR